jgi:hypothetical protein
MTFLRFILDDGPPPSFDEMQAGLQASEPEAGFISIDDDPFAAHLAYGEVLLAVVERNVPGDGIFEDELDDLREEVLKQDDQRREIVLQALQRATGMVAFQPLPGDLEFDKPMAWVIDWLFAHRSGLLQIDLEGFFDAKGRIISLL